MRDLSGMMIRNRAINSRLLFGTISHSQERMTVNHDATGSSPVAGATLDKGEPLKTFAFVCFLPRKTCIWNYT